MPRRGARAARRGAPPRCVGAGGPSGGAWACRAACGKAHAVHTRYSLIEYIGGTMPATDLQLDWLRAFVAVVDAGSLTAAAPHVHRSQSALSMQLKKLEDAVGRAVLTRGPRHLE